MIKITVTLIDMPSLMMWTFSFLSSGREAGSTDPWRRAGHRWFAGLPDWVHRVLQHLSPVQPGGTDHHHQLHPHRSHTGWSHLYPWCRLELLPQVISCLGTFTDWQLTSDNYAFWYLGLLIRHRTPVPNSTGRALHDYLQQNMRHISHMLQYHSTCPTKYVNHIHSVYGG